MPSFFLRCILLICVALISGSKGNLEFSVNVQPDVINNICSKIKNKNYCMNILNSDPLIKTADLKGVAGILVQQAYFDATTIKSKATLLAQKESNAQLKTRYSLIAAYHKVITGRLLNAKGNLNDSNNIYIQAQASLVKVFSCEDLFLFPAPKEPTDLFTRIQNLDYLLSMIMADVNLLPK